MLFPENALRTHRPPTGSRPVSHAAASITPMTARRAGPLKGHARVPGDKSISHRALILGALATPGIARQT